MRYTKLFSKISIPLLLALFIGAGASHAQSDHSGPAHSTNSQPPASVYSGLSSLVASNNSRAGDAGPDFGSCENEKRIPCGKDDKKNQRCCRKVCTLDAEGNPLTCGSDTISCDDGHQVCAQGGYASCCPEGRCPEDPRSGCQAQNDGDDNDQPGNGGNGSGNGDSGGIGGIGGGNGNNGGVWPPPPPGQPGQPGAPENPNNGDQGGNNAPEDPADPNAGQDDQPPAGGDNEDEQGNEDEQTALECNEDNVDQMPPCERCKCYAKLDYEDCKAEGTSTRECREIKRKAVSLCQVLPASAPGCAGEGPWKDCCEAGNRVDCKNHVCQLFFQGIGLDCATTPVGRCYGTGNCDMVVRLCCGNGVDMDMMCSSNNVEGEVAGCYSQTQHTDPPAMPDCIGQPDNEEEPGNGGGNNGGDNSDMPDSPPATGGGMPTPPTSGTATSSSPEQEPTVESGVASS